MNNKILVQHGMVIGSSEVSDKNLTLKMEDSRLIGESSLNFGNVGSTLYMDKNKLNLAMLQESQEKE